MVDVGVIVVFGICNAVRKCEIVSDIIDAGVIITPTSIMSLIVLRVQHAQNCVSNTHLEMHT